MRADYISMNHPVRVDLGTIQEEGDFSGMLILPEPSRADMLNAGYEFEVSEDEEENSEPLESGEVSGRDVEEFLATRAGDEWRDSRTPIYNYVWPFHLEDMRRGDKQELANRLRDAAPNITLFEYDGSVCVSGFSLSAAGTDLSDDIGMAYITAGYIPPVRVLHSVARNARYLSESSIEPYRAAMKEAENYGMLWTAENTAEFESRLEQRPKTASVTP